MVKERYGCSLCGKGIQNKNLVSFSKNRVHKIRRPNLHNHKMKIDGESVSLRLCSSCKRSVRQTELAKYAKKRPAAVASK